MSEMNRTETGKRFTEHDFITFLSLVGFRKSTFWHFFHEIWHCTWYTPVNSTGGDTTVYKKAKLTHRERTWMHEDPLWTNLSSPTLAIDIWHDDDLMKARIYRYAWFSYHLTGWKRVPLFDAQASLIIEGRDLDVDISV